MRLPPKAMNEQALGLATLFSRIQSFDLGLVLCRALCAVPCLNILAAILTRRAFRESSVQQLLHIHDSFSFDRTTNRRGGVFAVLLAVHVGTLISIGLVLMLYSEFLWLQSPSISFQNNLC